MVGVGDVGVAEESRDFGESGIAGLWDGEQRCDRRRALAVAQRSGFKIGEKILCNGCDGFIEQAGFVPHRREGEGSGGRHGLGNQFPKIVGNLTVEFRQIIAVRGETTEEFDAQRAGRARGG